MIDLCTNALRMLEGKKLATAESCTGGMIGAALTSIPGSSSVYCGGVVCYTNQVKRDVLKVPESILSRDGAVSSTVAEAMAGCVRDLLGADVAISVTGLAGPGGDDFGNPVGTVYIGYSDARITCHRHFLFFGDRQHVRTQATQEALKFLLEMLQ